MPLKSSRLPFLTLRLQLNPQHGDDINSNTQHIVNTEGGRIFQMIVTVVQGKAVTRREHMVTYTVLLRAGGNTCGGKKYFICPPSSLNTEHLQDKHRGADTIRESALHTDGDTDIINQQSQHCQNNKLDRNEIFSF